MLIENGILYSLILIAFKNAFDTSKTAIRNSSVKTLTGSLQTRLFSNNLLLRTNSSNVIGKVRGTRPTTAWRPRSKAKPAPKKPASGLKKSLLMNKSLRGMAKTLPKNLDGPKSKLLDAATKQAGALEDKIEEEETPEPEPEPTPEPEPEKEEDDDEDEWETIEETSVPNDGGEVQAAEIDALKDQVDQQSKVLDKTLEVLDETRKELEKHKEEEENKKAEDKDKKDTPVEDSKTKDEKHPEKGDKRSKNRKRSRDDDSCDRSSSSKRPRRRRGRREEDSCYDADRSSQSYSSTSSSESDSCSTESNSSGQSHAGIPAYMMTPPLQDSCENSSDMYGPKNGPSDPFDRSVAGFNPLGGPLDIIEDSAMSRDPITEGVRAPSGASGYGRRGRSGRPGRSHHNKRNVPGKYHRDNKKRFGEDSEYDSEIYTITPEDKKRLPKRKDVYYVDPSGGMKKAFGPFKDDPDSPYYYPGLDQLDSNGGKRMIEDKKYRIHPSFMASLTKGGVYERRVIKPKDEKGAEVIEERFGYFPQQPYDQCDDSSDENGQYTPRYRHRPTIGQNPMTFFKRDGPIDLGTATHVTNYVDSKLGDLEEKHDTEVAALEKNHNNLKDLVVRASDNLSQNLNAKVIGDIHRDINHLENEQVRQGSRKYTDRKTAGAQLAMLTKMMPFPM